MSSPLSPDELQELNRRFESAEVGDVLRWSFDRFGDGAVLSVSFGGISGMVLLDLALAIEPSLSIFYLDTGLLFPEVAELIEITRQRYGIEPISARPELSVEEMEKLHGEKLWLRDPDLCCRLRKVEPNRRLLFDRDAWITGLRRDQSEERSRIAIVGWDERFDVVKINPLATWSRRRVWDYAHRHRLPYNQLIDRGYPSIGCIPCTARSDGDGRTGRWAGFDKTECGLHG